MTVIDFRPKTGVASAAPKSSSLRSAAFSVTNRHSAITIRSFDPFADAESLSRTASCKALFDAVLSSEPARPMLMQYEPRDLASVNATMVEATHEGHVVGTLYFHRENETTVFKGVVVHPAFGGMKLATAMVSTAIMADFTANGSAREYCCTIREFPERLNEAARASFSRLGFLLEANSRKYHLKGDIRDRHRFSSAEQDSEGAVFTRYRRMTAGSEALGAARAFLAVWSEAILPFPLFA